MAAPRQVLGQYAAIALRVPHPLRAQRLCGGFGPSGHILGIRRQLARAITGDQISGNLRKHEGYEAPEDPIGHVDKVVLYCEWHEAYDRVDPRARHVESGTSASPRKALGGRCNGDRNGGGLREGPGSRAILLRRHV